MGLDMYLTASKFVSSSDYGSEIPNAEFSKLIEIMNAESFVGGFVPNITLDISVAYWRKANAIHQWFINNCTNGEDNCRPMHVSRKQLEQLLNFCKIVDESKNPNVANEVLPPQSGFFFGTTDIDEWYWDSVQETIEQLERCLSNVPEDWDFEYRASW
jgi:hypothetical protein